MHNNQLPIVYLNIYVEILEKMRHCITKVSHAENI